MNQSPKEYATVQGLGALKALAHGDRLGILRQLRSGPQTAADVARALELPPQKIGYHIKKLEAAGLVRFVGTGRKRWKEERLFAATAQQYLVDPGLACDDHGTQAGIAAEVELRFREARLEKTLAEGRPQVAQRVLEKLPELVPGRRLLILGGPFTLGLADAIVVAAEARGVIALQHSWGRSYIFGRLDAHTAEELAAQDLFPAALMESVDAVCQLTSSIPQGAPPNPEQRAKLPHLMRAVSEFQHGLRERGVPFLEVSVPSSRDFEAFGPPEQSMDTYWRAVAQDPEAIAPLARGLSELLHGAQQLCVSDGKGGELVVDLAASIAPLDTGRSLTPSLPGGSCSRLVEPGTARGSIATAYTMAGGQHYQGTGLELEAGRLAKVSGCSDAAELVERIDAENGDVRCLAYITIGLSPIGDRLTGKTSLDSIQAGVVTLAFGSSEALGGSQSATLDLRFPLQGATVTVDGIVIQRDGHLDNEVLGPGADPGGAP